ncbi:MAG: thiamine-phosphate kinase [Anaerolineae bacterium]|nr:thiamine-phosphate kinase [Gloeobacterales cyanobacterium ES-bin-313]
MANAQKLSELGERGLLALLQIYMGKHIRVPAGDDGAVLALPEGELVVTTDILFDEVHFSDLTTAAYDVGWRAAAANLSDLAAMGATAVGTLIGLGLSKETPVEWVQGLYEGFTACADPLGGIILGGDTCRSKSRTVAVTAFGVVDPTKILRRNAARSGDALVITGTLGGSKAGLEVMLHPELFPAAAPEDLADAIAFHRRPLPRLGVPKSIFSLSDRAAAMDTSDGLADAVLQVCEQSGCGAIIDCEALPIHPSTHRLAGNAATDWALYGGEDYELLIALPKASAELLVTALAEVGLQGTIIGSCTESLEVKDLRGALLGKPSFAHFS